MSFVSAVVWIGPNSLRSRRLELVDARKNGHAPSRVPVLSIAPTL